jgi:hypothetical protein
MTPGKEKWVLMIENKTPIMGVDASCVVGPVASADEAKRYASSPACDYDGANMRVLPLYRVIG